MKLLIILILALAFILAPIIALKPRGRESRLEKLRLLARERGARFSMRRLPALPDDLEPSAAIAVYSLPPNESLVGIDEWILRRTHYTHELHFYQDWDWASKTRPSAELQSLLTKWLPEFPDSVTAISAGPSGVSFYWVQEGEERELIQMLDVLTQIKNAYQNQ